MLSVLFGVCTIPIIYLIGKRISGAGMGLAAALLLALSPFHIRFAQETRMYTLLTFNAAAAIYALVRLLSDSKSVKPVGSQFKEALKSWRTSSLIDPYTGGGSRGQDVSPDQTGWRAWINRIRRIQIQTIETDLAWIAFILFSAATMLTHNTAVLFPFATNFFILSLMVYQRVKEPDSPPAFQAPSFMNWVKAQVGIFILWSPWLSAFIKQSSRVFQEFWIPKPSWETVIQAFRSFLNESTLTPSSQMEIIWILYALVFVFGLLHFRKKMSQFTFLAVLFAVPFLGELIVSIWRPIFYQKTLIWITIPMFLALAAGILQFRFRLLIMLVVGIFASFNLFFTVDYFQFYTKEDWSTAAGYVANFAEEGDLVLFNANWVQIPFDYYFRTYEHLYSTQVEKRGIPEDMFESGILEPKMTEADIPMLVSLLEGRDRAWLVYSHNWYTDPQGLIPQTLESKMELTRQRYFYGGQVFLYERP
jgi:hypothetical protein